MYMLRKCNLLIGEIRCYPSFLLETLCECTMVLCYHPTGVLPPVGINYFFYLAHKLTSSLFLTIRGKVSNYGIRAVQQLNHLRQEGVSSQALEPFKRKLDHHLFQH